MQQRLLADLLIFTLNNKPRKRKRKQANMQKEAYALVRTAATVHKHDIILAKSIFFVAISTRPSTSFCLYVARRGRKGGGVQKTHLPYFAIPAPVPFPATSRPG